MLLRESGRRRAVPVVLLEQRPFALAHDTRLAGLGVVVAEHVQDAVHDEQGELVVERPGVCGRGLDGHRRADDDVTEQTGPGIASAVSSNESSGNDSTSVGPCWPMCSALSAAISSRSTKVSVSSPARPSACSTARRQIGPAVGVDCDVGLLVADDDVTTPLVLPGSDIVSWRQRVYGVRACNPEVRDSESRSYAATMSATIWWRTTSAAVRWTKASCRCR